MTVMVMGEALVDVVVRDGVAEGSAGGSPANVALGLARLGIGTTLHTSIAHDDFGERIAHHLGASDVTLTEGSWSAARTSSAVATIGPDGGATYDFDVVWDPAPAPPRGCAVFHTGSIAAALEPGAALTYAAAEDAKATGAVITFDPNIRPTLLTEPQAARKRILEFVAISDVVKLSDEDAAWLFPHADVDAVIDRLLELGPAVVAVTRGENGSVLSSGSSRVRCRSAPVSAVDTIGAGDTVMVALIARVLRQPIDRRAPVSEAWLRASGVFASTAAAITVGRAGADLPWAHELATASDGAG